MNTNAKQEFFNAIRQEFFNGVRHSSVRCAFIQYDPNGQDEMTGDLFRLPLNYTSEQWNDFIEKLDFEYEADSGYSVLSGCIWLENNVWLERYMDEKECEYWILKQYPEIPEDLLQ